MLKIILHNRLILYCTCQDVTIVAVFIHQTVLM